MQVTDKMAEAGHAGLSPARQLYVDKDEVRAILTAALAETTIATRSALVALPTQEPVAWMDGTGTELHKLIMNYQKQDMIRAGGKQGERAPNYSIPLYTAPPAVLESIPDPDLLAMADGVISLHYEDLDAAQTAFDRLEALTAEQEDR